MPKPRDNAGNLRFFLKKASNEINLETTIESNFDFKENIYDICLFLKEKCQMSSSACTREILQDNVKTYLQQVGIYNNQNLCDDIINYLVKEDWLLEITVRNQTNYILSSAELTPKKSSANNEKLSSNSDGSAFATQSSPTSIFFQKQSTSATTILENSYKKF